MTLRDENINSFKPENAPLIEGIDCYGNERQVLHEQAKFFNNPWLSDIIIKVGDEKYNAHKLILVRASEVFERMLSDEWNEAEKELCLVEEKECICVFTKFLRYLYGCHIILNAEDALPILVLADKYNVSDLRQVAIQYAVTNLIPRIQLKDLFHVWFQYSTKCYHTNLVLACVSALAEKMDDITSLEEWKAEWIGLDRDQMLEILKCSDLVIKDEYQLWLAVERWLLDKIQKDRIQAPGMLTDILPYVRFPMMTSDQLCDIEQTSKLAQYFPTFFAPHLASAYKFQALSLTSLAMHFNNNQNSGAIAPTVFGLSPVGLAALQRNSFSTTSTPTSPPINNGPAPYQRNSQDLGLLGNENPQSQGPPCTVLLNPIFFPPIPVVSPYAALESSAPTCNLQQPQHQFPINGFYHYQQRLSSGSHVQSDLANIYSFTSVSQYPYNPANKNNNGYQNNGVAAPSLYGDNSGCSSHHHQTYQVQPKFPFTNTLTNNVGTNLNLAGGSFGDSSFLHHLSSSYNNKLGLNSSTISHVFPYSQQQQRQQQQQNNSQNFTCFTPTPSLTFIDYNVPSSYVYLLRNYTEIRWDKRIVISNVSKLQKFAELSFWITTRSSSFPATNRDWELKVYPRGFSPTNEDFRCLLYSNLIFDQPRSVEYCLSLVNGDHVVKCVAGKKNFAKTRYTADIEVEKRVDLSEIINSNIGNPNLFPQDALYNTANTSTTFTPIPNLAITNDRLVFQLAFKPVE